MAAALAAALGYIPYRAFGPRSVARIQDLQLDLVRLQEKNRSIHEQNVELRQQIKQLKNNNRAIERVARDELGLVRPTDIIFQFE